jgi:GNAT superfamily N-acetyltransferase
VRSADYRIVTATAAHVDVVLALRDEAAHWLIERGIDQWSPGEIPRRWIEDRVADGSVFLLWGPELETVGTVTVLWSDELIWGDTGADAGYVHMLIVTRRLRGKGLGVALLTWAETHVAERGRPTCRLDCARGNSRLRKWYEQAGYVHVGDKDFAEPSWARPVALYEKPLAGPSTGTC